MAETTKEKLDSMNFLDEVVVALAERRSAAVTCSHAPWSDSSAPAPLPCRRLQLQ